MDNTATINVTDMPKAQLCTSCIVCNESVPLNKQEELVLYHGGSIHSKICDKCKAAILYMREQMP